MSSLKKLKKLKKAIKPSSKSKQQLRATNAVTATASGSALRNELAQVSRQAGLNAVRELATPLNPLLSWFEEGRNLSFVAANESSLQRSTSAQTSQRTAPQVSSIARLPLKSPPCKRCPALAGGFCKCAQKRFG
ncbi:hypothetical protein HER31_04570 [Ferrimonas lipolytica]|uniref:Uncharacterized protein n=2 Tax=Ferrimonas lipolytica TaxID=2724191 RepID=A0A6H1UJK6_9GAMM|nr:hypothetical protein HER31_04570 [Ferrimonas lipolytica]